MIVDFDDFCASNHRLDLLHELKAANPLFRVTLFAIPEQGTPKFWASVPDWCELAVHGWWHPDPWEASKWSYVKALYVMRNAPDGFVQGFKAPGWQISDPTYQALMDRGWWCADHPDNEARRPEGLLTHVVGTGDHWHGHIQDVCGNGLAETWDELLPRVRAATSFELVSESVQPWKVAVAA
jgi:hypothetical protein